MKQNPKTLLTCLLILVAMCCDQRAMAQTLVLWHADGTTTDVELFTQPQIKFEKGKVLITSSVLDMEYTKENVLRFTYKGSSQGIAAPQGDANVSREGDRLVFHNVRAVDQVAVYKTNGIRVPVSLSRQGTDVILLLSKIPQGVYLLSVNGRTSKFKKQ